MNLNLHAFISLALHSVPWSLRDAVNDLKIHEKHITVKMKMTLHKKKQIRKCIIYALLVTTMSVLFRCSSLGVKWPGREADHSPPSSAEVEVLSPNTQAFMAWCSVKAQGRLYLYPYPCIFMKLVGWGSIPDRGRDFPLRQRIHTASEAHSASYPTGKGKSLPGVKWPGASG
jgi:hypothetical protein